jgi:acyl-CoA synthetase (NDP forming)
MALHTRFRFDKLGIPAYSSPEDAARAMNALVRYGLFLKKIGCYDAYIRGSLKGKKA